MRGITLQALGTSARSCRQFGSWQAWLVVIALSCGLSTTAAFAHERRTVGSLTLTLGWQEEPAYAGLRNAVEVTVTDARGAPVADPGVSLRVDVSFGSATTTVALSPTAVPGVYAAPLVPTRSGTYTFRVHGSISGQPIDTTSTCSGQTFDCVVDVGEVQFPSRDPSPDELATRLEHGLPRAERAGSAATAARQVALAALGVAVLALAVAVGAVAVRRGGRAG